VKKGKIQVEKGWPIRTVEVEIDVPDGIIAHLTRECGGNVHDRNVVVVTSSTQYTSGTWPADRWAPKRAADLETGLIFYSAFRRKEEDIPHTPNNWICYNFKERRIVPTHYTIRNCDLKSWLVETSADGESWREVAREEGNKQLNGRWLTGTFPVAGGGECRFIRLVNIGRNHAGNDALWITAWEIFGTLVK
jgi:hypothetical protein